MVNENSWFDSIILTTPSDEQLKYPFAGAVYIESLLPRAKSIYLADGIPVGKSFSVGKLNVVFRFTYCKGQDSIIKY